MSKTLKGAQWARYVDQIVKTQYGGVQAELARALGVSAGTVNRWTNQGVVPRHPVLRKLAEVTGRPIGELIAVAYEVDPEDAELKAQGEAFAVRVPANRLEKILDDLEEAKASGRIKAKDYKSARDAIILAAEAHYALALKKANDDLPDAAAAVP